jgi:hypothetical protein
LHVAGAGGRRYGSKERIQGRIISVRSAFFLREQWLRINLLDT